MPTCRTCEALASYCDVTGKDLISITRCEERNCPHWQKRETPLLVDTLAEVLEMVWSHRRNAPSPIPGETIYLRPQECQMLQAALARYQKEVNSAPKD